MKNSVVAAAASAAFVLSASSAFAHASFSVPETPAESYYTGELRIPHGCDGKATNEVWVKIPEGFINAKPKLKPGWKVEIIKGDYQKAYELHGKKVTSGALEIHWTGGEIPDDMFDGFEISGKIAGVEAGASLPFVTTQKCGADGSVTWSDIAKEGQNPHDLEHPAPAIAIVAAAEGHGHDHMQMAAAGGEGKVGDIQLSGGMLKGMLPGQAVGGGFVTITNGGASDDRLVSATSTVADHVEIHEMSMENDVMKMRQVKDGLAIAAGATVELKPGGYHFMFMGVKAPFKAGDTVPVTLTFEKAGAVEIQFPVVDPSTMKAGGHKHK